MPDATLLSTLILRVEVPDPPVMLEGENDVVGPEGETPPERATVPVKPFVGAMVSVELPELPACIVTVVWLAVMVKSGVVGAATVTWTVTA